MPRAKKGSRPQSRFHALVHYVCDRCDSRDLGSIKLNKILYYSDMESYRTTGQSITGETYVKREFGPAPSTIVKAIKDLEHSGKLAVKDVSVPVGGDRSLKREYISLKRPEVSLFTAQEIDVVNRVASWVCNQHTALSISEFSHGEVWQLAEIGEEIPYFTVFAERVEIEAEDLKWAAGCMHGLQA